MIRKALIDPESKVPVQPELEHFRRRVEDLSSHPLLRPLLKEGHVHLSKLALEQVALFVKDEAAYYVLMAAAGLNRTSLKRAVDTPEVRIVPARLRRALAILRRLPVSIPFSALVESAVTLRSADLNRKARGTVEALFRERLREEGIPISMTPPVRRVPGLLIGQRKPDGVYPDPASGRAPLVYLEVKNVRRVADDIQKRLYEIAEASIEMKTIYGQLRIEGFALQSTFEVESSPHLRAQLRARIVEATPIVIALLICSKSEAERYRAGAEAFVDRLFFQEEVEECIDFLEQAIRRFEILNARTSAAPSP